VFYYRNFSLVFFVGWLQLGFLGAEFYRGAFLKLFLESFFLSELLQWKIFVKKFQAFLKAFQKAPENLELKIPRKLHRKAPKKLTLNHRIPTVSHQKTKFTLSA
jgi:hypothetical protein